MRLCAAVFVLFFATGLPASDVSKSEPRSVSEAEPPAHPPLPRVEFAATRALDIGPVSSPTGQPATLASPDPLMEPRKSSRALTPPANRSAAAKVTAWAQQSGGTVDSERVRLIVTLDAVELPLVKGLSDPDDIAWLEHEFVDLARNLGFAPLRGLSSAPVVIGEMSAAEVLELAEIPYVVSIAPDYPIVAHRVEGGSMMSVPAFKSATGATGSGIGVAVVDSGIDESHPELAGQLAAQGNYTAPNSTDYSDSSGHGTAVAGIIAGKVNGVAPGAKLWDAKIFDAANVSAYSYLIAALDGLYSNRLAFGGLHIINMSVGFSSLQYTVDCDGLDPAITTLINNLHNAQVLVFVSSGNEAKASISFPSCLSKVVSVGAVYDANLGSISFANCSDATTAADKVTCYSNSAAPLDILAPSHCSRTTDRSGGTAVCFGGTSAAAPYAAGVGALLRSAKPSATITQVRSAMTSTGKQITDVTNITRPRIDVSQAFAALNGGQCAAQQRSMSCGATVSGTIDSTDCANSQGYRFEWWQFQATAGQPISVSITSPFKPYLFLLRPDLTDATQSGTGSLLFTADQTGAWWVAALAWEAGGGSYQLKTSCSAQLSQCVPDATTACLLSNRFKVKVRYRGAFDNAAADRETPVKPVTGFANPNYETAFFYFNSSNNIELMVKMLDQGNVDSQNRPTIAVLYGVATPLRVELTITDTKTGAVRYYLSDFPKMQGFTDFTAFVK